MKLFGFKKPPSVKVLTAVVVGSSVHFSLCWDPISDGFILKLFDKNKDIFFKYFYVTEYGLLNILKCPSL